MRKLVQNMPWPVEFAIVVAGAFGLSIIDSVRTVLHPGPAQAEIGLWHSIGLHVLTLLILGAFLRMRGWTFARLGTQSHWMDGLYGAALAAGSYLLFLLTVMALNSVLPQQVNAALKLELLPKVLSPWIVAALVLVSTFYEEVFVTGYVITALKDKVGETVAINASVVIRLSYNVVYGVVGIVGTIPIGLLFGYWYARTGRLWPVLVAQGVLNLLALLPHLRF